MLWRVGFALTAGVVAYATLVFPDRLGAMPDPAWGWAIAAWGALVLVPLPGRRGARAADEPEEARSVA